MKKDLLAYLAVFVGALLLIDAVFMSIVSNFNLGLVALGVFSLGFIVYGILLIKNRAPKWLHVAVIAPCVIVVALSCFLATYGETDNARYDEDVLIVLGAGIRDETVSATLAWRLDAAVEYSEKNPDAIIIVSGGQGPQEGITEALAMERYLIEKGVPAEQIIREEESTSTYENFLLSHKLLEQKSLEGSSVAFVTNAFHVYRAEKTARRAGISAARHIGAPIDWYAVPVSYMREVMAVAKFWALPPKAAALVTHSGNGGRKVLDTSSKMTTM
ncbi:MAG: YdcF family protein [Coriobacteriia bacterium]|nr:YdcF family protein [Coriobacteriia bacterium]